MSGVLAWLKSNVVIVVFCVLILVLPPAGFIGSSTWNAQIKKNAQDQLSNRKRNVDAASRVTYTLPPIVEGEQAIQDSRPPNAAITAHYKALRAQRQAMIEDVLTRAVLFNKKDDRRVLVPGLFPGVSDAREERRLVREMADLIAGTPNRPSVYADLFGAINAGVPTEKADVARRVVDAHRMELDRVGGDISRLTPAEVAAFNERMKGHRLSAYARRAEELSVYGSPKALHGADPATHSVIFDEVPSGTNDTTEAFKWQMDYWFVEDLLRAVRLANSTEDGLMTEVPRSPVKRIISIRLDKQTFPEAETASAGGGQDPYSAGGMGRPGALSRPMPGAAPGRGAEGEPSYTGRKPGPMQGVYTIRRGTITVIAASDNLVRFIDAISRTNFMTVIGVNMSDVDLWADLEEGYYYGPEHVVRAEIEVESAWLHFWLADVVTDRVAAAWGIERPAGDTAP